MKKIVAIVMVLVLILACCAGLSSCEEKGGNSYVGAGSGGGSSSKPSSNKNNGTTKKDPSFLATDASDFKDVSSDTDIKSNAIILVDVTDNKVIAGANVDAKIYPASMTKVMTLLVACENIKDKSALLTVTADMVAKYSKTSGASIAFPWEEGYQVTVEDALHLVIYESDTYACWLLAEYVSGSEEKFVEKMNKKAEYLCLTSTNFTNCTGLFNENHYTTCREMAAIMAAAMSNELAETVLTSKDLYTVDIHKGGKKVEEQGMWSGWYTGRLEAYRLANTAAKYVGGGSDVMITAGKTGYEEVPKNCFVTAAENDITGRKYVCVQVGRTDSSQETVTSKQSTDDTRTIYRKYAIDD